MRALRTEKFLPFYGDEINSSTTPYELGRGYKVKMEKDYFLGKAALMQQKEKGIYRRLAHFVFENHDEDVDIWPWGRESIYRNGKLVGNTTSACYGYTVEKTLAMGFVQNPDPNGNPQVVTNDYITDKNAYYEIELAGRRFHAFASIVPPPIPIVKLEHGVYSSHYKPKVRKPEPLRIKK